VVSRPAHQEEIVLRGKPGYRLIVEPGGDELGDRLRGVGEHIDSFDWPRRRDERDGIAIIARRKRAMHRVEDVLALEIADPHMHRQRLRRQARGLGLRFGRGDLSKIKRPADIVLERREITRGMEIAGKVLRACQRLEPVVVGIAVFAEGATRPARRRERPPEAQGAADAVHPLRQPGRLPDDFRAMRQPVERIGARTTLAIARDVELQRSTEPLRQRIAGCGLKKLVAEPAEHLDAHGRPGWRTHAHRHFPRNGRKRRQRARRRARFSTRMS